MGSDPHLRRAAEGIARAVDGVDWDSDRVQACVNELLDAARVASPAALGAALAILVERVRRSRLADADGAAQAAISAGTLVEIGAPPEPLAETLLERLPEVLVGARRFADVCIAELGAQPQEDEEPDDVLTWVDERAITRPLFRAHLERDRAGAVALAYLRQWVLPTVAALTRARPFLEKAARDAALCDAASRLRESDAHFLDVLLGVELESTWLVLCPTVSRGFRVIVDGIASNYDAHALLAAALVERGVPGEANPADVIAYIEGEAPTCSRNYVAGTWNLYDARAARFDLNRPSSVPHEVWVWGEGRPRDIPIHDGVRVVLVGPPAVERTWSVGRVFSALPARVTVAAELSAAEVGELLRRFGA